MEILTEGGFWRFRVKSAITSEESRTRALWRYLWELDRRARRTLRMEPAAMLEHAPWASEEERALAARLSGGPERTDGAGGDGAGGGDGGDGPGPGGGSGGGRRDEGDDAALARTRRGRRSTSVASTAAGFSSLQRSEHLVRWFAGGPVVR